MEDGVGSLHAGDQASIDVLWHSLHRDIRRRGVDVHVADDVAQETWLRIAARPPRLDRPLRPWLRVVGARVLAEILRRDRSRSARECRVARADTAEGEEWPSDDSRVMRLVAGLSEPYREVITLRYVDGLEIEEIARKLERTQGTVRSQLKRGLERLRARLARNGEREAGTRRSARSLLGWLGIRRGGRELGPLWSCVGIGGVLALATVLVWSLGHAKPRSGSPVAGFAADPVGPVAERTAIAAQTRRVASGPIGQDAEPAFAAVPPRPAFGTVRLPDGTPGAGAAIWKGSGKGRLAEAVAVADAAGRYEADAIEFSRFLWATLPGWLPSRRTHVGSWVAGRPSDLVLENPRGRLELALRDEDGRALAGVEAELDGSFDHPATALFSSRGELQYESEVLSGRTDERGRLELPKPPLARARLRIRTEGRVDHVVPLLLAEGDSSLEVVLPRPAFLGGTVVDARGEPVSASVVLVTQAGLQSTSLATDSSGTFEVALDPGPFELCVTEAPARGHRRCNAQGVLEPGERRISSWVLEDEGGLRGRALAAGSPLAKALVVCTASGANGVEKTRAYTDSEGRFALSGRTPGETVDLQLFSPVWDLLCAREAVTVGREEIELSSELDPTPRRLVLEFACEDPALLPTLVELRSKDLHYKAVAFPVDPATRTCTLAVPRSTDFQVFPWVPALGAWKVESNELAPGDFQRLRVPRPARVTFRVDLPPGVPAAAIRGGVRVYGLKCTWVASQPGLLSIREVLLDPATLCAQARMFPGRNRWFLQGPGLVHVAGALDLAEGESVVEHVRLDPGVEAEVIVRFPAQVGDAVAPVLIVSARAGRTHLDGAPVQVAGNEATFRLALPADATALQANAKGLSGWRRLAPGELVPGTARPSFTIELLVGEPAARLDQAAVASERD